MTTITVTGNLGNFTEGQVLTSDQEIATYHRAILNEGAEKPTELSDATILSIVKSIEGDGEEFEFQRIEALQSAEEPKANEPKVHEDQRSPEEIKRDEPARKTDVKTVQASSRSFEMMAFAERAPSGMLEMLRELAKADDLIQKGALEVLRGIEAAYTKEELDTWPDFGTDKDNSNNPDKYTFYINGRKRTGSKYADYFDSTMLGIYTTDAKKWLEDAKSANVSDIPEEFRHYKAMTLAAKKQEKARLDRLRTRSIGYIGRAMKCRTQKAAIESLPGDFVVRWSMVRHNDGREELRSTPNPVVLTMKGNEEQLQVYSITSFLTLKPKDALADMNANPDKPRWDCLVETAGRGTKGDDDEGKGKVIKNVNEFTDYCYELAAFLQDRERYARLMKEIQKPSNKELVLALGDASEEWEALNAKIDKLYQQYAAERQKESRAA